MQQAEFLCVYMCVWTFLGPFLVRACCSAGPTGWGGFCSTATCQYAPLRLVELHTSHLIFLSFHIPTVIILFSYLCFRSIVHKNIPLQRTRASGFHTSNCIQQWHIFTLCEFLSLLLIVLLPFQRFTYFMWFVEIYIHSSVYKRNNLVRNVSHSCILHIFKVLKKGNLNDEMSLFSLGRSLKTVHPVGVM